MEQRMGSQSKDGHTTPTMRPSSSSSRSWTHSGSPVTLGGFSGSGAFYNHSKPSTHSHCRFNTRTVVLYPLCWGRAFRYCLPVSFALSVFRYLVFEGTLTGPSNLKFALRMTYANNRNPINSLSQYHSSPLSSIRPK